ncbi:hypothetical protein [Halobaculum sp. MBLA0143]|uniref:hypothetical protein n=1 Tax=Halobaculum sp. MBLA0143 TaxID=3079933 RepID=UPI003526C291
MTPSISPSESSRLRRSLPRAREYFTARKATAPVRAVGFYAAIALPFVYLPMVAGGLSAGNASTVGALLAVNVLALLVGHGYGDA